MKPGKSRRDFLRGTSAAAGVLLAAQTSKASEPSGKPQHEHQHGTDSRQFPRDHAGRGGPVGSATDRGKLVPGLRPADQPPVPVVTPDLTNLSWKMVGGFKEFHLVPQHVRREFLP